MQSLTNKKIVLGICGGIAAYKAAFLVRALIQQGAKVRVVLSEHAENFVTPLTLQALSGNVVRSNGFDLDAERAMSHIELAKWADCFVVAPATADFIAKMAHGMADDLLSTIYLATTAPVVVCPAMNQHMWQHAATQENIATLIARGVHCVEPGVGEQACGDMGYGRLAEFEDILATVYLCHLGRCLSGISVLITAGPTYEKIDPVRFIGNRSSGKMGYALARAAKCAGADVTLISGPTNCTPPGGICIVYVETAGEMLRAVESHLTKNMIVIGAAAVADYCVAKPVSQKVKKSDGNILSLVVNPDIIQHVVATGCASFVVGFAAETENVLKNAKLKLKAKKLDMVIANQVGEGLGFDCDENAVHIITEDQSVALDKQPKITLAGEIVAIIAAKLQNQSHS